MNADCEIIRDLLPLYADDVCSEKSRALVAEHLQTCPDCRELLDQMGSTEVEAELKGERGTVLQYGEKRFKRRSAAVGTVISALFMVPILASLIVNLATGQGLGWFYIVLASMAVAASIVVVPLLVPENRLFWSYCAFCASLTALLAVVCAVTGGGWFWLASAGALFGLGLIGLPFALRTQPARRLIGGGSRKRIVAALDATLFVNLMNAAFSYGGFTARSAVMSAGTLAGAGLIALEIIKNRGGKRT